jgi:anthranilate phosphoribosyltransferase
MLRLLFRKASLFSKITPQILPTLTAQFEKQPSLKALGAHYSPENTDQLFDLIISSKVTPAQSNGALEHLLELCRTESDEELNLVVNVMKQKAINYTRLENLLEAASQFE